MRDVWEGKKKRNRVGEGKVERAEGVLTLESPPESERYWSRDWICMRL